MTSQTYYENHLPHDLFRIPFPSIGPLTDGIPIRFYSLAYLLGLALAWWFLKRLARQRRIALTESMVADLIIPFALLGVMIGGRLGFVLFYDVDPLTRRTLGHHRRHLDARVPEEEPTQLAAGVTGGTDDGDTGAIRRRGHLCAL